MTEKQWNVAIERGGTFKFIAPRGVWQCFCCLRPARQLDVLEENAVEVKLICEPCASRTERALTEQRSLFDQTDELNRIF